jgi:hypothetical protein
MIDVKKLKLEAEILNIAIHLYDEPFHAVQVPRTSKVVNYQTAKKPTYRYSNTTYRHKHKTVGNIGPRTTNNGMVHTVLRASWC